MRIVKNISGRDERTLFLSRVFDDVITRSDFPMNFDQLEFSIGYGKSSFLDDSAKIIINPNSPLLQNIDRRVAKTLITFEIYRLFVQKIFDMHLPRLIEDVTIGKKMVRYGYGDDLAYVFYILMANQRITDIKSFIQFNLPWLVFRGEDKFYYYLFRHYAGSHKNMKYMIKTKKFFQSLQKDLLDAKNLKRCVQLYEEIVNAGN